MGNWQGILCSEAHCAIRFMLVGGCPLPPLPSGKNPHRASASKLKQLCDDTSDNVLIEKNGVTQKWVATPIWSDSAIFEAASGQNCL